MKRRTLAALAALSLVSAAPAHAQVEIQWWHSMAGKLGDKVNEIAEKFNASQKDYKVVAVYKGQYDESLTAAIAAYRAGKPPQIVQVFEVGTATMMAAQGAVMPVYKLMAEAHEKFDPKDYLPAVTGYYSDTKGNLLSMPFNSSTQVLYYNKDAFKKAGLDPEKPPVTWPELMQMADKINAAGVPCAFTTGWQSWVQLESFSAWHNVPFATLENGFGGLGTKLEFNGPVQVMHIQNLGDMAKKGIARFFTFLSGPEIQLDWHKSTGYVPITLAAYELAKTQGLYKERPGFDVAIKELTNKPPTPNSKGLRLGNFVQIRNVIDEELESVWSGQKSAKQALDDGVRRGNELLARFQKANQ